MNLEILGSGGAVTTPKPLCNCELCIDAKKKNYTRYGPSAFIHGPDILIDTPEEINIEINRSKIKNINDVFYSHWHPDHTAGKRFFESNIDWIGLPPNNKKTKIVITDKISSTFESCMSIMGSFKYYDNIGIVDLIKINNDADIELYGCKIKPIQLAMDYVFGYEIIEDNQKYLIIMDEMKNWKPNMEIIKSKYNIVYLPLGIFDVNPFSNKRLINENHPILKDEQTVEETLELIKKLNSECFILSHIEEPDNITHKLGKQLSIYYSKKLNKDVILAYDGMFI